MPDTHRNPLSPQALTLADLRPGQVVEVHFGVGYTIRATINSRVHDRFRPQMGYQPSVELQYPGDRTDVTLLAYLTDLGICPDHQGCWAPNYTTLVVTRIVPEVGKEYRRNMIQRLGPDITFDMARGHTFVVARTSDVHVVGEIVSGRSISAGEPFSSLLEFFTSEYFDPQPVS